MAGLQPACRKEREAAREEKAEKAEQQQPQIEDLPHRGVIDVFENLHRQEHAKGHRVEFAEGALVQHPAPADKEAEGDDQKARQHGVHRDQHMFEHENPSFFREAARVSSAGDRRRAAAAFKAAGQRAPFVFSVLYHTRGALEKPFLDSKARE